MECGDFQKENFNECRVSNERKTKTLILIIHSKSIKFYGYEAEISDSDSSIHVLREARKKRIQIIKT